MDDKYNKLKETLKPDKFTDKEFPVKSSDNNPWLKNETIEDEDGNFVPMTQDDVEYERPVYGKFLKDSHSAQDILQTQTGMNIEKRDP